MTARLLFIIVDEQDGEPCCLVLALNLLGMTLLVVQSTPKVLLSIGAHGFTFAASKFSHS